MEERNKELGKIKTEVLSCQKCLLYRNRTYPVIGEGSHCAKIFLCGEAPGFHEDKTGHPFCGAAGKVLDELLDSIGIKRDEVYICNILKCRPPKNREPKPEEIQACAPFLERQIKIIAPEVICTLGNYSTAFIFEKYGLKNQIQGISKVHGKVFEVKNLFRTIKIIPFYHPAVATYNQNMKEVLKKDFKILQRLKI
ncbi:MAG: DNA polymerase [candidate division Zixibacteria bacterium SM23_73]|nr:MAG: DNA polymerase [candidate division Zixibacteria bacterium SM23_73]